MANLHILGIRTNLTPFSLPAGEARHRWGAAPAPGPVYDREKQIRYGVEGVHLNPLGLFLRTSTPITVYIDRSECLPAPLNPLAERTSYFSQVYGLRFVRIST